MDLKVITGSDSSWGDSHMQRGLSVTKWAPETLGKQADILIVDGDPDTNINDLWNVVEVFFRGEKLERGYDESLAAIRQTPESF